jgi:Ca2+/Na+ antiporter
MAHQAVKPYSFLMYFLAIIASFFIGVSYAGIVEAGKGQMLAGGAIVFGYGVIGAFIGFIIAIFIALKMNRVFIIRLNVFLAFAIVAFFGYYTIKYQKRQKEKEKEKLEEENQRQERRLKKNTTTPAMDAEPINDNETSSIDFNHAKQLALLTKKENLIQDNSEMGLGMFSPNMYENKTLYFYGNINYEKATNNHTPFDSITFRYDKYNNIEIATAPSWLNPAHLKLDYGMLAFKMKTIIRDFVEVEVNKVNGQTSFVNTEAGSMQYWPEFLLHVHAIEFLQPDKQTVKSRPFDYADNVNVNFEIMQPIAIKQGWILVDLKDNNYKKLGTGWVKWHENGTLLVGYSLLS